MTKISFVKSEPSQQNGALSIPTMLSSLLEDDRFCDVVFRVGRTEKVEDIRAHRNLLACRSSVFDAMLYGPLAERGAFIEVTDITADIFKLMKKFIYKDDVNGELKANNIIELYYAANKYELVRLKELCAVEVKKWVSMEKIGDFLEMMYLYDDDKVLRQSCTSFVRTKAWKLFQKEEYFVNLKLEYLIFIWRHDTNAEGQHKLPEVDIYKGAIKWAKAECERQQIAADPKNLRVVLKNAVDLFCFPRMSLHDFQNVVRKDGLFTLGKVADMILYMVNVAFDKSNCLPPFGRAASVPKLSGTDLARVRLPDGEIKHIQHDLLQVAIAAKPPACGCDCKKEPKVRCAFQTHQLETANTNFRLRKRKVDDVLL